MTRRRPPPIWHQKVATTFEGVAPGALGGRSRGYSPPVDDSDAEAFSVGTVGAVIVAADPSTAELFAYDTFTLASATPTLTISETAIAASMHVYLNGIEQTEGTDYIFDGDASVAVQAAMGALSGDKLHIRYAYAAEVPDDTETG